MLTIVLPGAVTQHVLPTHIAHRHSRMQQRASPAAALKSCVIYRVLKEELKVWFTLVAISGADNFYEATMAGI